MVSSPTKTTLRQSALLKRAAISEPEQRQASRIACRRLAAWIAERMPEGGAVAGYSPIKSEIDPRPALTSLARKNYGILLPDTGDTRGAPRLRFRVWEPGEALKDGAYGIPVPALASKTLEPALLIVPLLAFDRRLHRLGYGRGYYDAAIRSFRTRARPILAIGLAFARQEVISLPDDPHDERLDAVITEHGIFLPE